MSDWSSDVCSSDLLHARHHRVRAHHVRDDDVKALVALEFVVAMQDDLGSEGDLLTLRDLQRAADGRVVAARLGAAVDSAIAQRDAARGSRRRQLDDGRQRAMEACNPLRYVVGCPDDPAGQGRQRQVMDEVEVRFRSEEHTSELQSLMRNSYASFLLN